MVQGHGVKSNLFDAFLWFLKSANKGHAPAQYTVGKLYLLGEGFGMPLELVLAASLLSMVLAALIIPYNGRIARKLVKSYTRNSSQVVQELDSVSKDLRDHVIICGYGRSGQYLGRFLKEENIPFIALDIDPTRVHEAAAAGQHVMYGDAGRRIVLEAAGGARAKALIVSYADMRASMKVLHVAQESYPDLPVIVRTYDETHMDEFRDAGATEVVPEVLEGSLMLASHALVLLGVPLNRVVKRIRLFREERYKMFKVISVASPMQIMSMRNKCSCIQSRLAKTLTPENCG